MASGKAHSSLTRAPGKETALAPYRTRGAGHSTEFIRVPALASTTTASNCLPTAKLPRCSFIVGSNVVT